MRSTSTAIAPDPRATVSLTLTFDGATWSYVLVAAARAGVGVRKFLHDLVRGAALPADLNPKEAPVARTPKSPNQKLAPPAARRVSPASPNRPENIIQPLAPSDVNPSSYKGETLTNIPTGDGFGKKPEGRP